MEHALLRQGMSREEFPVTRQIGTTQYVALPMYQPAHDGTLFCVNCSLLSGKEEGD